MQGYTDASNILSSTAIKSFYFHTEFAILCLDVRVQQKKKSSQELKKRNDTTKEKKTKLSTVLKKNLKKKNLHNYFCIQGDKSHWSVTQLSVDQGRQQPEQGGS